MATTTRRSFAHRIDLWDSIEEKMVEHLAGVEDVELAMTTFRAACERWPSAKITLQAGAKEDSRRVQTETLDLPLSSPVRPILNCDWAATCSRGCLRYRRTRRIGRRPVSAWARRGPCLPPPRPAARRT